MATVFIAGHGRMVMGDPTETVPDRVTIGWAVPAKYASCPQVSRNMIAGRNTLLSETKAAGERYNEHWLVPDGAENMIMKAKDLVTAVAAGGTLAGPAASYWLFQPRGKNAVALSGILRHLRNAIPGHEAIEVRWTCCRSPIGQKGVDKAKISRPWTQYVLTTETDDTKVLALEPIADPVNDGGLDARAGERDWQSYKFWDSPGVATLVQASETAKMTLWDTWPGINGVLPGTSAWMTERPLPN